MPIPLSAEISLRTTGDIGLYLGVTPCDQIFTLAWRGVQTTNFSSSATTVPTQKHQHAHSCTRW